MPHSGKFGQQVEQHLDQYLDSVAGVLFRSGMERRQIEGILGDIRAQVHEMLASRAGDAPSEEDMRAVIAELDPPESYAQTSEPSTPVPSRFSRLAVVGACWAGFFFPFFLGMFMVGEVRRVVPGAPPPGPTFFELFMRFTVLPLGLSAPFATTILGVVAINQIRASAGKLTGLSLALADALFFPLLLLDGLIFWAAHETYHVLRVMLVDHPQYLRSADALHSLCMLLALFVCLLVDFLLARMAWRAVKRS